MNWNPAAINGLRPKWIGFDAYGTLIHAEPPVAVAYHQAAMRHGSRLSREVVESRFRDVFAELDSDRPPACGCVNTADPDHTCETREAARWRILVDRVLDDVKNPDSCFRELFAHFGQPAAWRCFDDVAAPLERLHQAGYRLAIASNFDARLHSVIDGLSPLQPIELRLISSEIGWRKPSKNFYQALLEQTGCRPHEILFVGDDYRNDIEPAVSLGIPAVRIDRRAAANSEDSVISLHELADELQ